MSENKMLIDASHSEETRVVVVRDKRVEEFDFESAGLRQLRGNIYLAKVTRVEPSLQAAFVDYGGNRNGFLAFNEIHPDYYQIPVADREALLQEEAEEISEDMPEEIAEDNGESDDDGFSPDGDEGDISDVDDDVDSLDDDIAEDIDDDAGDEADEEADEDADEDAETDALEDGEDLTKAEGEDQAEEDGSDARAEVPVRRKKRQRKYKIQEVIKRRQVILVQVVKEERGNKGAALTTYLSLAGRYCVLMPNTAHGGGISRKINNPSDRKRLKDVAQNLEIPEGMGLIVRTAGAKRTKTEIKRDYDYLLRMWEDIRTKTLESSAPNLIYEEGNLIKRSIRDLYGKDMNNIIVEGEDGYKEAKDFMKKLMPSHAKNIKHYKEERPLFLEHEVETQLDAMYSEKVKLRSGGYLVINQTEALVAIDINSGKATREHHIEDTALNTNIEAADEIARQLRLRDLAGLIVIDFIDMEERRNNRQVERRLKDSLKNDRARIQVGRISSFGLLEMSRQRMRPGVLEGSTHICPMCQGRGFVRTINSAALQILRVIETYAMAHAGQDISVRAPSEVVLYILNQKRDELHSIEKRYDIKVFVNGDEDMLSSQYAIATPDKIKNAPIIDVFGMHEADDNGAPKSRKRRRGGSRRKKPARDAAPEQTAEEAETEELDQEEDEKPTRRRRRGRRGGRRRRRNNDAPENNQEQSANSDTSDNEDAETQDQSVENDAPKPRRRRSRRPKTEAQSAEGTDEAVVAPAQPTTENSEDKPKKRGRPKKSANDEVSQSEDKEAKPKKDKKKKADKEKSAKKKSKETKADKKDKPKKDKPKREKAEEAAPPAEPRKGWWQTG